MWKNGALTKLNYKCILWEFLPGFAYRRVTLKSLSDVSYITMV